MSAAIWLVCMTKAVQGAASSLVDLHRPDDKCWCAVPYMWSGSPVSNSMGFISDTLPWIALGLDHPNTAASEESPAIPSVEQIQQSFASARQRQVPHIDSDFAQSAVENLRAEMQQAIDDAAERSSAGTSASEVAESGFDTPSAPTSQVSKLVVTHNLICTPKQYLTSINTSVLSCVCTNMYVALRSCLA